MQYTGLKTLTGLAITDLPAKLDEELPPEAYKPVPGGADLTDIDPNHMTRVLNQVFGLCGIGWGYTLSVDPRWDSYTTDKGRTVYSAHTPLLTFWYKMVDGDGSDLTLTIPSTGGSENGSLAYALKGAITSAIGQAVSKIGFQESVYLGKRDHRTVKGGRKATPQAAQKTCPEQSRRTAQVTPLAKPAPAKAALQPPTSGNGADPAQYVFDYGLFKGKTIAEALADPKGPAFLDSVVAKTWPEKTPAAKAKAAILAYREVVAATA